MIINYLERLKTIDRLITIKATGTPKQLANRLNISESSLYNYLSLMKEYGAPISYCKNRQSYYYETSGKFEIRFVEAELDMS